MRSQSHNQVVRVFAFCGRSLRQAVVGGFLFFVGCSSVWDSFLLDRCPSGNDCTQDLAASDASDMPDSGAADLAIEPPTCSASFSAPAACGQPTTLSWNCLNAKSCTRECTGDVLKSGLVACSSSEQILVSTNNRQRCKLSASNDAGTSPLLEVTASCIPKPQCTASIDPVQRCGTNVRVTWSCTGATSCTYLCTGTVPTSSAIICSDSQPIQVNSAGSCELTAEGPGGYGYASVPVNCSL
jgi:hypothetical protein